MQEVRYDEIAKMGKDGPGSGGIAGVRALHAGGGCILIGSPRAAIDIQLRSCPVAGVGRLNTG
jgi:hypothetical protein